MKIYFYIVVFVLFVVQSISAQENSTYLNNEDESMSLTQNKESRFSYRFNSGVGFSSFGNNAFGTGFVAPEIGYNLTERLRISGGFAVAYSLFPHQYSNEFSQNNSVNLRKGSLNYYMFAKGEYFVSSKLRVHGAMIFNTNQTQMSFGHIGIDYKITENSTISLGFEVRKPDPGIHPMGPTGFYGSSVNGFDNQFVEP